MSKKKLKYPSRYSSGKNVTAAQYIAELICEKQAQKSKKELPQKFWDLPTWKKTYKQQIFAALGLLKIYSEVAIIKALKTKEAYGIYSLRAPSLDRIIKEQETQLKNQEERKTTEVERKSISSHPRKHITKNTELGKLRGLDD